MKKYRVFSVITFALFVLITAYFSYLLFSSQLVPWRLALIFIVFVLLFILIAAYLIFRRKSRLPILLGGVISLLFSIVLFVGALYFGRAISFAQNITTTKTEVSALSVYMRAGEATDATELTAELSYGILEVQDRENTDIVVARLSDELGKQITTKPYDSLSTMLNALFNKEVDAIILNSAFLDILDEMEGYEDASSRLQEVKRTHVEIEVPVPTEKTSIFNPQKKNLPEHVAHEEQTTFTVYISGIDNRGGLIEKSRSDVNIIAVVNTETHQILLVTTPRDYYVPLSISNGIKDKLTHAGIYGVQVSMDTLSMLYDIDFDYYFRVNFGGFVDIVEAMGGVTVYVEKGFSTTEYSFDSGPNELNGYKALSFVRNRFGIGDQQRGKNQMAFIKGVINKATSTDMLLNFSSILSSVEGSFETSMPYDVLSALVRDQIESGANWNVVTYAVTGTGASRKTYSMNEYLFVFLPDETTVQTAKDLMQQVYNGETITQP